MTIDGLRGIESFLPTLDLNSDVLFQCQKDNVRYDQRKEIVLMKKRFSGPQIVAKLRQADVLIGQGKNIPELLQKVKQSGVDRIAYIEQRNIQYISL